jgi:transposase
MPVKTLSHWVEADRQDSRGASPGRRVSVSEQESELSRLRAENATLRLEREILKNRPTRSAEALMNRNFRRVQWMHAEAVAGSFLEV